MKKIKKSLLVGLVLIVALISSFDLKGQGQTVSITNSTSCDMEYWFELVFAGSTCSTTSSCWGWGTVGANSTTTYNCGGSGSQDVLKYAQAHDQSCSGTRATDYFEPSCGSDASGSCSGGCIGGWNVNLTGALSFEITP